MKTMNSLFVFALLNAAVALAVLGCKTATSSHASRSDASTCVRPYPLNKCVVSDETFEHGKPYNFVRNGQEVKLCCKDCLAEFDKDPAKYMAKINEGR